jgi:hypothetical protein
MQNIFSGGPLRDQILARQLAGYFVNNRADKT